VRALDHGDALVGLEIPADFAVRLRDGRGAQVQMLLDGSDSNTATVAQGYASASCRSSRCASAAGRSWRLCCANAPGQPRSREPQLQRAGGGRAIIFLVCLLLTSLAVVREREIGTLEQLMVSPLASWS